MLNRAQLDRYPGLQAALDFLGAEIGSAEFLSFLLEKDISPPIEQLDHSVRQLTKRFLLAELKEQLSALFRDDDEWDKATTELLGLHLFDSTGCLETIGWPPGGGNTPPFEGRLQVDGVPIPFDVKSASGAGIRWLGGKLRPIAEEWARKKGLDDIEVVIHWTGTLTRQCIAQHWRDLEKQFRAGLMPAATLPISRHTLKAGATTIEVTVRARSGSTVNAGRGGVEPHAASIASTLRSHVQHKGDQARNLGPSPFVIVYVRPPGSGDSDLSEYLLATALRAINDDTANLPHPDLWLGTLFLDWTPSPSDPRRWGFIRPTANWPSGLSSQTFSRALQLSEWPLALSATPRQLR